MTRRTRLRSEPLLQVGTTIPCPLLQLEFNRCGAENQWLLQFMRARASNLHHGQPVLRSVKVSLLTPPSGDVETLFAPFKTAGVHVDVKWTERRQERKYNRLHISLQSRARGFWTRAR